MRQAASSDIFSGGSGAGDSAQEPEVPLVKHPFANALLAFASCRSQIVNFVEFENRQTKLSEVAVLKHEPEVCNDINRIHDELSEPTQLEVYRFFLTAVHRNSVIATRFDPSIMSSPERTAAMEAEFDDITHQMSEIINDVALHSFNIDRKSAQLLAADLLWTLSWWVHARQDVLTFTFDSTEDPTLLLLLGRQPDVGERVSRDIYHQATIAELEYRAYETSLNEVTHEQQSLWSATRLRSRYDSGNHM